MKKQKDGSALDQFHKVFVHDDATFAEHPDPIFERYASAVVIHPELGRRKLYESFEDLYRDAYENQTGEVLLATLNFCFLQRWFWTYLNGCDAVTAHACAIETNACQRWIERLHAKYGKTKPWRRAGKKSNGLRKPTTTDLTKIESAIFH